MNKIKSIVIIVNSEKYSANQIDKRLLKSNPPLKGRIKDENFILDVRTIFDDEIDLVAESFRNAFN